MGDTTTSRTGRPSLGYQFAPTVAVVCINTVLALFAIAVVAQVDQPVTLQAMLIGLAGGAEVERFLGKK